MATEYLQIVDAAAGNVYFAIWKANEAKVFDFDDQTFKLLAAPPTTPYVAATEVTGRGGVGDSGYYAALDLADLNDTPAIAVFVVEAYRRLGGSPALATDVLLGSSELRVAAGSLVASGSPGDTVPGYVVKLGMTVDGVEGDNALCWAWVELNGQPVALDSGDTCEFDCFEGSTDVSQFGGPTTAVNPGDNGQFYTTVADPNFLDGKQYLLKATIVFGGVTLTGQEGIPALG